MRAGNMLRELLSPDGIESFFVDLVANFQAEANEIIAEADRRLADPKASKALARAREQADRSGMGFFRAGPRELDGTDLDLWSSLLGSIHWVEALERQLGSEAVRTLKKPQMPP